MAYLSDIFGYLNEVNLAMQGINVTCFKVKDKINVLQGELKLWDKYIAKGDVECFENLSSFFTEKFNFLKSRYKKMSFCNIYTIWLTQ